MSTTTEKRNVIDYLWEWAESQGDWARILVQLIVEKERELNDDDMSIVYAYFLKCAGINHVPSVIDISRPTHTNSTYDIEIVSLSKVSGINRLATDQTLNFGKNLTIIYGENGSGKSGYGRILKKLGCCYDKETTILHNITESNIPKQSATIKYNINHSESEYVWTPDNSCSELNNISFFNNNCVHLSLNNKRDLLVTPSGFRLFELVGLALNDLSRRHKKFIQGIDVSTPWLNMLHSGSAPHKTISTLTKDTSNASIEEISTFSDIDSAALVELENKLKGLNKKLLQTETKSITIQISELNTTKGIIETARKSITSEDIHSVTKALTAITLIKGREQIGLKDIAESRGIELWSSPEFMNFIKSADLYITRIGKQNYPDTPGEVCIYCRQEIADKDAAKLLKSYRKLLSDTTQQEINTHTHSIEKVKSAANNITSDITLHQASFGTSDNNDILQPEFLQIYNESIIKLKEALNSNDTSIISSYELNIPFDESIQYIDNKITELNDILVVKSTLLANIEDQEKSIITSIHELIDRRTASQYITQTIEIRDKKKIIDILENKSGSLSTDPISRKTTKARDELVKKEFVRIFNGELNAIKRTSLPVTLDFKTERGQSKLVQYIEKHQLSDILSEGEQKAVALAEFLAELQMEKSKSPVIFDDPVTSLDHRITEEVAKRLATLSHDRQVIVFTHSIILFNIFHALYERPAFKKLDIKFYEIDKTDISTGILRESISLKSESFGYYTTAINKLTGVSNAEKAARGKEIAYLCYDHLRAALEVLVENDLFNKTVKRYKPNVAFTCFEGINPDNIKIHQRELCDLFERCCRMIGAHSNPENAALVPNLEEFSIDFEKAKSIHKQISQH